MKVESGVENDTSSVYSRFQELERKSLYRLKGRKHFFSSSFGGGAHSLPELGEDGEGKWINISACFYLKSIRRQHFIIQIGGEHVLEGNFLSGVCRFSERFSG